ncbi:recombinase family protein (plasmid) [Mesorhizobium sp. AR07]|nr:recombinase family protein [Mesorhizobium sp. AR07]
MTAKGVRIKCGPRRERPVTLWGETRPRFVSADWATPHELVWRDATIAHVHHILHNPAYAGAYVYGRRRINAVRQGPGSHRATSKVAIDDWDICIKDAHPGYINWEEFMANQRRLADNTNRYESGHRGAPRKGIALLQGLGGLRPMRTADDRALQRPRQCMPRLLLPGGPQPDRQLSLSGGSGARSR